MKAVPDFPNYRLTKDGKLYSLRKKKFVKEKPGGLKKYPRWELWRDGQRFHKWCHRLVCQVWVSCCIGLQVHHKNGDVLNYHPSNLVPLNPPPDPIRSQSQIVVKLPPKFLRAHLEIIHRSGPAIHRAVRVLLGMLPCGHHKRIVQVLHVKHSLRLAGA